MTYLFERDFSLPRQTKKEVDPALVTLREYLAIVNEHNTYHPDRAYDVDIKHLNEYGGTKADYKRLINRFRINGIWFEARLRAEKLKFAKSDEHGALLYDDGILQYFTDDELHKLGRNNVEYTVGLFDEDNLRVGTIQDEYNCVLIMVAREYRKFGLGTYLGKIARTMFPDKTSGGFTPSGQRNFIRAHAEFVRDALKSGRYSQMVRDGAITAKRVKQIVNSVTLKKPTYPEVNLGTSDANDWMLYEEYGAFVIYDKKLKDFEYSYDGAYEHFIDKMIKGLIFIRPNETYGIVVAYGGDSPEVRKWLLTLAASYCAKEEVTLVVDPEDIPDVNPKFLSVSAPHYKSGYERFEVTLKGEPVPYEILTRQERIFRKTFDKYDEFKSQVVERAFGKFRQQN